MLWSLRGLVVETQNMNMIHCRRLCLYVIMSRILTFYLTFQKRLKVSLSYMFTMISYCVEISIIYVYTYVRLRDLFCIISVCSLRLFFRFLSGVRVFGCRCFLSPFPRRYRDVGTTGAGSRAHTQVALFFAAHTLAVMHGWACHPSSKGRMWIGLPTTSGQRMATEIRGDGRPSAS